MCPFPGRCVLYTDADGNSLCDYMRTATSVTPTQSPAVLPDISPAATQVTLPQTIAVPGPAETGLISAPQVIPALIGIVLFLVLLALLIRMLSSGMPEAGCGAGLYASCILISFAMTGIVISIAMPDAVLPLLFGGGYLLAGIPVATYLWIKRSMTRRASVLLLLAGTAAGFLSLVPIIPGEFTALVNVIAGRTDFSLGIALVLVVLATPLVAGRVFCACFCPAGTLQEIIALVSGKHIRKTGSRYARMIRTVVFVAAIVGSFWYISLIDITGVNDLFALELSAGFIVFCAFLAVSFFIYRPFCRFVCPVGLLFSALSRRAVFGIMRSEKCTDCRMCEEVCPAGCAGRDGPKDECYLCGRCVEACPVEGAVLYARRKPGRADREE